MMTWVVNGSMKILLISIQQS